MSLYDADVSRILGGKAYNYILERVSHGFIGAQHMRDISAQLHPRVCGNHLRRVGSGNVCDEAEFCRILNPQRSLSEYTLRRKKTGADFGGD